MSRAKLRVGEQREFLNRVAEYFNYDWEEVARISSVCDRTLRDWRREKFKMSYEALFRLREISNVPLPKVIKILPEYWSAKKLGIIIRKTIRKPRRSVELAEFIGITLGDGGVTDYQITVTFNTETDDKYGDYVQKLIRKLLSISTFIISNASENADRIVASGKNLVEFLQGQGLEIGDKVKNEVDIPQWILENKNYSIACLRGLIDTDGSFYLYRHRVFNKIYSNFAMCFTNHSKPLLKTLANILKDLGFTPVENSKRVYLHKREEIGRYFKEVGTHNPKYLQRYKNYIAIIST